MGLRIVRLVGGLEPSALVLAGFDSRSDFCGAGSGNATPEGTTNFFQMLGRSSLGIHSGIKPA